MKRSEINAIIADAIRFMDDRRFALPPFGHWTPEEWVSGGASVAPLVRAGLGWDITDFGTDQFDRFGLVLFTLRNGTREPGSKTYAEKIMLVREGQLTLTHYHHEKTEDIINRGGGNLVLELHNHNDGNGLAPDDIEVEIDGVTRRMPAGSRVTLEPGQGICLTPGLYHSFWGEPGKGTVLVGEVSSVNDDHTDNCYLVPQKRFPDIEEDEPPLRLICPDYARWLTAACALAPLPFPRS